MSTTKLYQKRKPPNVYQNLGNQAFPKTPTIKLIWKSQNVDWQAYLHSFKTKHTRVVLVSGISQIVLRIKLVI